MKYEWCSFQMTYVPVKEKRKVPLRSSTDSFLKKKVKPLPGSIVACDLLLAEHTGIYIGKNRIVHVNGDGLIEVVSPKKFMARLNGNNTARTISVACEGNSTNPVVIKKAAKIAKSRVGERVNYSLLNNNCHTFTALCITKGKSRLSNAFCKIEDWLHDHKGMGQWRTWDLDD